LNNEIISTFFIPLLLNSITQLFIMISKIIPEEKVQQAKKWVEEADKVVIVSHSSPDGDAVGSSLGLYHFLYSINKEATVVLPDDFPDFLDWIPGSQNIIIYSKEKDKADEAINAADVIFAVDFNTLSRIGAMSDVVDKAEANKILLDHHPEPGHFCQLTISHPEISSACEMVFRLICRMGYFSEINLPCSQAIYTGMMTDTGAFTYNSNNTEIYIIISELIKKGIDKDEIYRNVYNNYSADRFRMLGYALSEKMRIYPQSKAAMISMTKEEQNRFQYKKGDLEGIVNIPLSIKDIEFSTIFREEDDKIRVSLRSQGELAVNKIAEQYFNGGGHKNAAGGESKLTMDETIALFEKILKQI
jgi:phosphoesterase RecJ-like protein